MLSTKLMNIFEYIANFKFLKNEWEFIDLRIDIPRESYGSDAINKHTQYSNPVAVLNKKNTKSFGAGFTLVMVMIWFVRLQIKS